jgi:hypothetical protein
LPVRTTWTDGLLEAGADLDTKVRRGPLQVKEKKTLRLEKCFHGCWSGQVIMAWATPIYDRGDPGLELLKRHESLHGPLGEVVARHLTELAGFGLHGILRIVAQVFALEARAFAIAEFHSEVRDLLCRDARLAVEI